MLNFTKGKIVFDGKVKNPYLDLEITKKIDGYDVFVRFKGRAKEPRFTFVSSPALSEEEIIALILFGRKSAVTSLGQLLDVSSSLSSLGGSGQKKNFFTTFRQTFGIDALELKPQNPTSPSKSPQALSIRKRITNDVDLVIEQTFNDSEESTKSSKASIERKINDNWSVEADASTDKSGSIGLNWVKRY
ncbi:MAG: translocation/assembly module TamB domain-containing protein [Chitinophagaceae bacterium]